MASNANNKVKLEICGSSYVISTGDPEEYLQGLAERLDHDMNQIMLSTPNASVTAAAVITALGYLDEAEKSAYGADNLRAQLQDYLEDAARARLAAEEAKRENERLRRELSFYEDKKAPAKNGGAKPVKGAPAAPPQGSVPIQPAPAAPPVAQPAPAVQQPAPQAAPPQQAAPPPQAAPPQAAPAPAGAEPPIPGQMGIEDLK